MKIHPDIEHSSTLHSDFYSDSQLFESLKETLFSKSWHWVVDADELKLPNQVVPVRDNLPRLQFGSVIQPSNPS